MSERSDQPAPVSVAQTLPTPPTLGVGHFAMVMTAAEVLMTIGQSRVAITVGDGGNPNPVQMVEWVQTLSIPPAVAVLMRDALTGGLESYVKTFGVIPEDPARKVIIGNPTVQAP